MTRLPTIFVNHGGGPLPLLGQQPQLAAHMKEVVSKYLPDKPKSIVLLSAHWESDPVRITSSPSPSMLYDYHGFPPETYQYKYPAPGEPELAKRIHSLLQDKGIESELDAKRGFDHGVFVPLMMMYPNADIPVVCVSLHSSLSAEKNMEIGSALQSLRDDDILVVGSGYTFHNMHAFFNPSDKTRKASVDFNQWLKDTITTTTGTDLELQLQQWDKAPGARMSHPREEHLLPLFMVAAAAGPERTPQVIYDTLDEAGEHAVTGYLFH